MSNKSSTFKSFYLNHLNAIVGFCRSYTKDNEVALDISQEAMYKVYCKYDSSFSYESTVSFLYTIARNLCLDHLRKSNHKFESIENSGELIIDDAFFLDEITRQETLNNIKKAVKQLNGRSYEIIILTLRGKSNNEIAEILGVSINTVKTIKKTAFAKLRNIISKEQLFLILYFNHLIKNY